MTTDQSPASMKGLAWAEDRVRGFLAHPVRERYPDDHAAAWLLAEAYLASPKPAAAAEMLAAAVEFDREYDLAAPVPDDGTADFGKDPGPLNSAAGRLLAAMRRAGGGAEAPGPDAPPEDVRAYAGHARVTDPPIDEAGLLARGLRVATRSAEHGLVRLHREDAPADGSPMAFADVTLYPARPGRAEAWASVCVVGKWGTFSTAYGRPMTCATFEALCRELGVPLTGPA